MRQLGQELIEFLLPVGKLSSATEVDPKACHDTVNDKETVLIAGKVCGKGIEELKLMLH